MITKIEVIWKEHEACLRWLRNDKYEHIWFDPRLSDIKPKNNVLYRKTKNSNGWGRVKRLNASARINIRAVDEAIQYTTTADLVAVARKRYEDANEELRTAEIAGTRRSVLEQYASELHDRLIALNKTVDIHLDYQDADVLVALQNQHEHATALLEKIRVALDEATKPLDREA